MNINADELKKRLTPEQYAVTQEKATERPFTGKYYNNFETGMYECVVCHTPLFSSDTKYDASCGWPSFWDAVDAGNITVNVDSSLGMVRTEVVCATCHSHLGHLFDDGPQDKTGQRYCINSASIDFKPQAKK